jgi:hypothetical protein
MAYSLVHDGDLALANNYEHKDFKEFYKGDELGPQGGKPAIEKKYADKAYSVHGNGLPVLLAPGFLVAGKTGATFELALIATLVVWLTWLWTRQVTGNRMVSYLAAGSLALGYFFNTLTGAIYPDMLMAAITLIVLIMTDRYFRSSLHQILLGLALGFLVVVHFKALAFTFPVLAILTYRLWVEERKIPWRTLTIVAVFIAYYFLTLHQWFGLWNLSTIEGGQEFNASPTHNAAAMLFDSNRGLLVYNPILILIFIGLPLWFKNHRTSFIITLLALLPTISVLCLIPNWNGSAAPTGRYIIEFLPAFVPAIGFALEALKYVWQRLIVAVLAVLTFLISLDATLQRFPYIDGGVYQVRPLLFAQIQRHTGLALDRLLPAFSNQTTLLGRHDSAKTVFYIIALIAVVVYGYYLGYGFKKPNLNLKASKSN